jgi:hypothetical protein
MSNDDSWIAARIREARERSPLVTEVVSARMGDLLKGQISERQLSSGELATVAVQLLSDMVSVAPSAESKL